MPSNVLLLHLKQTLLPIIWIFTEGEGDGIKSRLPFKKISTLVIRILLHNLRYIPKSVFTNSNPNIGQLDFPSSIERDSSDFYSPSDFIVGSTVEILYKK